MAKVKEDFLGMSHENVEHIYHQCCGMWVGIVLMPIWILLSILSVDPDPYFICKLGPGIILNRTDSNSQTSLIWSRIRISGLWMRIQVQQISVADPDPPDPHVFWSPGSGSTSQRYGSGSGSRSGSGSFYHHAKKVRKTLVPTIL